MTGIIAITQDTIKSQIYTIRGVQVMMDRDLAVLYGVETKNLNKAVSRNINRFPEAFSFFLTDAELENLRFQFGTSSSEHGGRRYPIRVFSESGIAMLSAMLRSETAVEVSVQIMDTFVKMRKFLRDNADVFIRLDNVERKQSLMQSDTDKKFDQVFNALESAELKPKQGIFYDGQVFDAYTFVSDLIRAAKSSIVLIDNYIDDSVLQMFAKRLKGVSVTIYTQKITAQLALDRDKYNLQYEPVVIKEFKQAHDRFMILDEDSVYHIGASLKDLGKKWFAFSKMKLSATDMLSRLK